MIRVTIAARSEVGRKRTRNEDAFLVAQMPAESHQSPVRAALDWRPARLPNRVLAEGLEASGPLLLAVADGVSGSRRGGVASHHALASLLGSWIVDPESRQEERCGWLMAAFQRANREVHSLAGRGEVPGDLATTLTAALLGDGRLGVAHVGDSRLYHLQGDTLRQITVDDSIVQELVSSGRLTPEQARCDKRRHRLTNALGLEWDLRPATFATRINCEDRLLLSSDGIHGPLSSADIQAILRQPVGPAAQCARLVAAALEAGSKDDLTAVVVHVLSVGSSEVLE